MPATGISPTLPMTRRPACPMAVDCGKFGIFAYGILTALANVSAKSPRPEPRTRAMRGRSLVLPRMNLAARWARRNSTLGLAWGGLDLGVMFIVSPRLLSAPFLGLDRWG